MLWQKVIQVVWVRYYRYFIKKNVYKSMNKSVSMCVNINLISWELIFNCQLSLIVRKLYVSNKICANEFSITYLRVYIYCRHYFHYYDNCLLRRVQVLEKRLWRHNMAISQFHSYRGCLVGSWKGRNKEAI